MTRLLLLALVFSLGCASDKDRVANATASYMYFEARYEDECVEAGGPEVSCEAWHDDLAKLYQEVKITNEVQKVGNLPKKAKQRLRVLQSAVEE